MASKNQHCSFCGKPKEETKRLITGPDGVCICDECVEICKSMVDEYSEGKEQQENVPLKKPAEIKAELDQYIVGQDKAKRVLSVARDLVMDRNCKRFETGIRIKLRNLYMIKHISL